MGSWPLLLKAGNESSREFKQLSRQRDSHESLSTVIMLPLKPYQILAALVLLSIITWLGWPSTGVGQGTSRAHSGNHALPGETVLQYTPEEESLVAELNQYGISNVQPGISIHYAELEFVAEPSLSFAPPGLQDITSQFPSLERVKSIQRQSSSPQNRISIPIAQLPPIPDASAIVFGVATDLARLAESLDGFVHWASGNGARIVASIQEGPSTEDISTVLEKARSLNVDLKIVPDKRPTDDRYFSLIDLLHQHRGTAQWAALIDDDTFFPSMSSLLSLLSKHDATRSHYIGALSEDFYQIAIWGMIAYGGAGIFLSMPLVDQIVPHLDACLADPTTGDKRVAICVLTYTTTRMTHENQLHQIDLKGDATGFYEALRPQPVSVHHWKSWNHLDMPSTSLVSKICGDQCIFQKYRFQDDWQLTNGVSLVKYSHARDEDDIRMEKTWNDSRGKDQEEMFRHSLAPLKPKDTAKIQYVMEGARVDEESGRVCHLYVRRLPEEKKMEIVEVVWMNDVSVLDQGEGGN